MFTYQVLCNLTLRTSLSTPPPSSPLSLHSPWLASHPSANDKYVPAPGPGTFPQSSWKALALLAFCVHSNLHSTATSLALPSDPAHLTPLPHFSCFNAEMHITT